VAIHFQDRYAEGFNKRLNIAHLVVQRNRTSSAPPIPVTQETHRDERATTIPTMMVDVKEQLLMHPERVRLLIDRKMVSGKWLPRTVGLCVDNFPLLQTSTRAVTDRAERRREVDLTGMFSREVHDRNKADLTAPFPCDESQLGTSACLSPTDNMD
jgi:hypothetical protein